MTSFLEAILEDKKLRVALLKEQYKGLPLPESFCVEKKGKFFEALGQPGLSLISEIKKASPSKGIINPDFDPISLAKTFQDNGARAYSVLTDEAFFQGNNAYLTQVKQGFLLPVLRKDFILDVLQVREAYDIGADAILLILAILSVEQAQLLLDEAARFGLDVLIEVHSEDDVQKLYALNGVQIIGFNNRDLDTFSVDTQLALLFKKQLELEFKQCLFVAESGYDSAQQLDELGLAGFDAVLIGEGLIRNSLLIQYFEQ